MSNREPVNTKDNRYFINHMPVGARDCEDGGLQGMQQGPSAADLAYAAKSKADAKAYNIAANALNARRCKEIEARQRAMAAKLGRALKNSDKDMIAWTVGKEIK